MNLYIAEKPSLGRAIADALPKPHQKQAGYIKVANGDIVTWCIGHLLEQADPEHYNPIYKKWQLAHLPIMPEQWQLKAKKQTSKQLGVIKSLVKNATQIVHAGDPDREGQLLVDEVLSFLKVPQTKIKAAKRCLINDMTPAAVAKSIRNMRQNQAFIPLSISALARSRADWLYGLNMTRLCTLHGQQSGYNGVLSVGRVQTPLLGLVVNRDQDIENFIAKPFYEVWAKIKTKNADEFQAKWIPSEHCAPYQDESGRILNLKLAQTVVKKTSGQIGTITKTDEKLKKQAPPLPFNLSSLQIEAAKAFHFSAKQVLDICQNLYEKYKVITYPRSDCRYLPKAHLTQAKSITSAIASIASDLTDASQNADLSIHSKAWNDSKVDAHHAIIPTSKSSANLPLPELKIYTLIARQYLIQFYPAYEYMDKLIELEIQGGLFRAKSKQTKRLGWKSLTPNKEKNNEKNSTQLDASQKLPNIKVGEPVDCIKSDITEKQTTPPDYFNDATLLSAMTNIGRFVESADLKKVLKETDGIGTEATRASIIELLFKRQFLSRQGKQIKATEIGKNLISALPNIAVTPDMTATWESRLSKIAHKEESYQHFMCDLTQALSELFGAVDTESFKGLSGKGDKNKSYNKAGYKKSGYKKSGYKKPRGKAKSLD